MIYFFTPYSFQKKIFEAWDAYMDLVQDKNDWVCLMDGDVAFLRSDFGSHMQEYISKFPDTGIFTCYVSRSRTSWMMPTNHIFADPNILHHKEKAEWHYKNQHLEVTDINRRIIGCLMLMKKSTWLLIREKVAAKCITKEILSVDSIISLEVIAHGLTIRLMKGMYIFHYYRHLEGADSKNHLL